MTSLKFNEELSEKELDISPTKSSAKKFTGKLLIQTDDLPNNFDEDDEVRTSEIMLMPSLAQSEI
jgi:hypothetical protein